MINKEKVKEFYLEGRNAVWIALELNCNVETVRKYIQRNLKQHKNAHIIAKQRDKEILKLTRREAKQYMSDSDFVKRNNSIYTTNEDGDIVLDKSVSGTISFDTPVKITNEFSEKNIDKHIKRSGYRKEVELFA